MQFWKISIIMTSPQRNGRLQGGEGGWGVKGGGEVQEAKLRNVWAQTENYTRKGVSTKILLCCVGMDILWNTTSSVIYNISKQKFVWLMTPKRFI